MFLMGNTIGIVARIVVRIMETSVLDRKHEVWPHSGDNTQPLGNLAQVLDFDEFIFTAPFRRSGPLWHPRLSLLTGYAKEKFLLNLFRRNDNMLQ